MRRLWCVILVVTVLLNCQVFALASDDIDILTIAVVTSSDARNIPAEEAFFERYPNAVIEYHLYTEEQLNTMLITSTHDFDLVILPYQILLNMAQKGYLASINQVIEVEGYPEQLIDLSHLLTIDDWLFALPVSVAQNFWIWDESISASIGISMPNNGVWTWVDYAEYAKMFPQDIDCDGKADTYLMYGSCLPSFPYFHNVNLNMFTQYAAQYSDFETFGKLYLDLFRENIINAALLGMDTFSAPESGVLIQEASAANPIDVINYSFENDPYDLIDFCLADEQSGFRFLPPPLLDENNISYVGSMSACGIMKQTRNEELATAFLQGMVSEDALNYSTFGVNEQMVSRNSPVYMYFDENGCYMPTFENRNNALSYQVAAGRDIRIISFVYSQAAFAKSQDFREKLSIDTYLMGRDFYDSAWSFFQEWYSGRTDDDELIQNMQYIFGIARGTR